MPSSWIEYFMETIIQLGFLLWLKEGVFFVWSLLTKRNPHLPRLDYWAEWRNVYLELCNKMLSFLTKLNNLWTKRKEARLCFYIFMSIFGKCNTYLFLADKRKAKIWVICSTENPTHYVLNESSFFPVWIFWPNCGNVVQVLPNLCWGKLKQPSTSLV